MSEKQEEVGKEAASNTAEAEPKSKLIKMSMDQAYAEIEKFKLLIPEKDAVIADLTRQLEEVNKLLESQEKGRLIGEILPRSTYKMDDLLGKSPEELKAIRATLEAAVPPKLNSVRFGVVGADVSDRELGLTVGDMSWSTAQKRKGVG